MSRNSSLSSGRGLARKHDLNLWVGLILTGGGAYALFLASGFDRVSRTFPMVVAAALVVCGLLLVVRCFRHGGHQPVLRHDIFVILLCLVFVGGWAVAIGAGLGFAIPTFLMQCGLLFITGQRNFGKLVLIAALVTLTAYLLFVVALDVRLPRSVLSFIAPGF